MKSFIITVISILCISGIAIAQEKEKEYVQLSDPIEETDEYLVFGSAFNSDMSLTKKRYRPREPSYRSARKRGAFLCWKAKTKRPESVLRTTVFLCLPTRPDPA